jgi:hypothetical protein
MSKRLSSTNEVIDALGGTFEVALLTGRGHTAPYNWLYLKRFPPNTYLAMTRALLDRGLFAPAWLWDQEPAPQRRTRSSKADASEVA